MLYLFQPYSKQVLHSEKGRSETKFYPKDPEPRIIFMQVAFGRRISSGNAVRQV